MESKPFNYDGIEYHFKDKYMVSNPDYKPVIINNFYEKNECEILKNYIDSQNLNKGLVYDGEKEIEIDIDNNPTLLTRFQLFCLESCGSSSDYYLEDTVLIKYSNKYDEFKPHWDGFSKLPETDNMRLRKCAFILYLNTLKPRDGGQTFFPIIDVGVRPIEGRLVQFQAVDSYGIDEQYLPVFDFHPENMVSIKDYEALVIEKFLTIDECQSLKKWIDNDVNLVQAGMYKHGKENIISRDRIAYEKRFGVGEGHPLLEKVRDLHATLSPGDLSEPILVVKYPSGGILCPHRDNHPHESEKDSHMGRRKSSIVVYLNNLISGKTRFPIIDKSYDCIQGNALYFESSNENNKSIYESLHQSLEILNQE
eukprot:Pgem_evm1s9947